MNNRTVSDLEINLNVRKIMVRHQIDLGWLSHSSFRGTVYIQGDLLFLPGVKTELTPVLVNALFDEIGCSAGVNNMVIELRNWHHNSYNADWQLVKDVTVRRSMTNANPSQNVFEIDET